MSWKKLEKKTDINDSVTVVKSVKIIPNHTCKEPDYNLIAWGEAFKNAESKIMMLTKDGLVDIEDINFKTK